MWVDFDSRSGEEEFVVTNIDPFSVKNILLEEVARIEKEWGLVLLTGSRLHFVLPDTLLGSYHQALAVRDR